MHENIRYFRYIVCMLDVLKDRNRDRNSFRKYDRISLSITVKKMIVDHPATLKIRPDRDRAINDRTMLIQYLGTIIVYKNQCTIYSHIFFI